MSKYKIVNNEKVNWPGTLDKLKKGEYDEYDAGQMWDFYKNTPEGQNYLSSLEVVYGPANSQIGYYDSKANTFYSLNDQEAGRGKVNKDDSELLKTKRNIVEYLKQKRPSVESTSFYKFEDGGFNPYDNTDINNMFLDLLEQQNSISPEEYYGPDNQFGNEEEMDYGFDNNAQQFEDLYSKITDLESQLESYRNFNMNDLPDNDINLDYIMGNIEAGQPIDWSKVHIGSLTPEFYDNSDAAFSNIPTPTPPPPVTTPPPAPVYTPTPDVQPKYIPTPAPQPQRKYVPEPTQPKVVYTPPPPVVTPTPPPQSAKKPVVRTQQTNQPKVSGSLEDQIAKVESGGKYNIENKTSSAVGKYQFLWNTWGPSISKVTGVKSKQDFKNNPEAQEKFFAWYKQNELLPGVAKLRQYNTKGLTDDQLAKLIHFKGLGGAKTWLTTGQDLTSANNMSIPKYLGK